VQHLINLHYSRLIDLQYALHCVLFTYAHTCIDASDTTALQSNTRATAVAATSTIIWSTSLVVTTSQTPQDNMNNNANINDDDNSIVVGVIVGVIIGVVTSLLILSIAGLVAG